MSYFKRPTSGSQKLPHIHNRSRISQGQIKTYHDRDALESLSQASTERTLSSNMVPEKPAVPLQLSLAKLTVTDDNTIEGKPHSSPTSISQPKRMPNRRRASTIRIGYF